jgi:T5SS/PEP-CTERM-associated repeat protein
MLHRRSCYACFTIAVLAFANSEAVAVTTSWNTNSTGSYTNAANWSAGVPTSADTAVFNRNLNIEYGVTFPGRPIASPVVREIKQLKVGTNAVSLSDSVNFNQLPASFKIDVGNTLLEDALIIGDTAGQLGTLNTTLADFSTSTAIIGNSANSSGTLNVNGGTLNITQVDQASTYELVIGNDGNGSLNIASGGRVIVAGETRLANNTSTSAGSLLISGANSLLQTGRLTGLSSPFGTISIQAGGRLETGYLDFSGGGGLAINGSDSTLVAQEFITSSAVNISGGGSALVDNFFGGRNFIVDGSGSSLTATESLEISTQGTTFEILNGGQVIGPTSATLGGTLANFLNIDGANSNLTLGTLSVGGGAMLNFADGGTVTGAVRVSSNGTISGSGTITRQVNNHGTIKPIDLHCPGIFFQEPDGVLRFDITSATPGTGYGKLSIEGTARWGGKLEVQYGGGYQPQPGDSFDILDVNSALSSFSTITLASLPAPLKWSTLRLYGDGVISIILPGDYNENGTVDAADFVVWREQIASNPSQTLPNDVTLGVGFDDYITWRANFGNSAPSGPAAAVPEPAAAILIAIGLLSVSGLRRGKHSR